MLTLDDEDYELLGFGGGEIIEETFALHISRLLARRREIDRDPVRARERYALLKKWRANNRKALLEHERRYEASEKGKRTKKKKNKTYYEKHRAALLVKLKARRAAQKAKKS